MSLTAALASAFAEHLTSSAEKDSEARMTPQVKETANSTEPIVPLGPGSV